MPAASESPESQEPRRAWRCVRTKPKNEHLAAQQLRVLDESVAVFAPRLRHKKSTRRGTIWFVEALFPGYIFVQCDWTEWQRIVLATTGVTGMVHFGSTVPEVPDAVVNSLRDGFPEDETLVISQTVDVGDVVEVAEGPLRGVNATVTRLLPARDRVAILLDFMGSAREIEVPLMSLLGLRNARELALADGV